MKFADLNLCREIQHAVADKGYVTATPIQAQCIRPILNGRDVLGAARTGTGKTAGFTLPILQRLKDANVRDHKIRCLVLTPTRELAQQIDDNVVTYSKYLKLRSTVIYGGVGQNPQVQAIQKGVDVLTACPGRLLDLHQQGLVDLSHLEYLVLDEADRMLDMGFIHDIRKVLKIIPVQRQTLLFSATFSPSIRKLAGQFLTNPISIDISPPNTTVELVEQHAVRMHTMGKPKLLVDLIRSKNYSRVLVFMRTKHGCNQLVEVLESYGIVARAIHGNKSQTHRQRALNDFKSSKVCCLVATEVAARGIDINELPVVVNCEIPNVAEDYVHRIGRTGRAGHSGVAWSFVARDELDFFNSIRKLTGLELDFEEVRGHAVDDTAEEEAAVMFEKVQKQRRRRRGGGGVKCFSFGDHVSLEMNNNQQRKAAPARVKPASPKPKALTRSVDEQKAPAAEKPKRRNYRRRWNRNKNTNNK